MQVQDVSKMDWGMSTNIDAVFDLILQVHPSVPRCRRDLLHLL